jgi:hypothetical protein
VDNQLYRVYRYPLERTSSIFASLFSLPNGGCAEDHEGAVDEHPIRLYGVPKKEFHVFLERIFSVFSYVSSTNAIFIIHRTDAAISDTLDLTLHEQVSNQEWLLCLAAAERWGAPSLRALAIRALTNARPAARIAAARQYDYPQWLRPAFVSICSGPALTAEDFALLTPEDLEKIVGTREAALRAEASGASSKANTAARNHVINGAIF